MPAMRAGSYVNGELWLRCPFCLDSQEHKRKAHFSVNNAGIYFCFRCSRGGKFSMAKLITLYSRAEVLGEVLGEEMETDPKDYMETYKHLLPGPATHRHSALDRYHIQARDIFLSRRPSGELVGLAVVDGKRRSIIGNKGFGFKPPELISSPDAPIRLVEGPYDVVTEMDVCVYGSISVKHLQALKGHCVILCPDGDIWTEQAKLRNFLRCLKFSQYSKLGASVLSVERLEDDKDPDQVPYKERWSMKPEQAVELYL